MPARYGLSERKVAVLCYVTREESEIFSRLSYKAGKSKSEWVRDLCVGAAEREDVKMSRLIEKLRREQKGLAGVYGKRG